MKIKYIFNGEKIVFRGTMNRGVVSCANTRKRVREMYLSANPHMWILNLDSPHTKHREITREQFWAFVNKGIRP